MTRDEWNIASSGAPAIATTFRQLADIAIDDAVAGIQAVKNDYHGMLPPPPWPAHPALVAALNTMRDVRTAFNGIERRYATTPLSAKARIGLRAAGLPLYREAAALASRHARDMADRPHTAVDLATRGPRALLSTRVGKAAAAAATTYYLAPYVLGLTIWWLGRRRH